jgi:hypothetical protein
MPTLATFLRALTACAAGCMLIAITWGAPSALAQGAPPPGAQQPPAQLLSPEQLDQLVAPIALYPDDLIGQILTASTYPLEAVTAARWSAANRNVKGPQLETAMQQQTWDPSVKALTAVPQVLAMMSDKLDWMQMLGDAYLAQPDDVAAAIQRLRLKAQAAGNLQATSQQRVRRVPAPRPIVIDGRPEPEYIVIEPVDPGVLYVPVYDPYVVYGPWAYPAYRPFYWYPPGYVAAGIIGFGAPFAVGAAVWAHYNWQSNHVDINVMNYNKFNHTNLANTPASQLWQHDPAHRGNIPYNNAALQQKFGKPAAAGAAGNPALQKTNLGAPITSNPKGGAAAPINNPAITNLNKNGGLKGTDVKVDKGANPKVDKTTNLKVDSSTKPNVEEKAKVQSQPNPKPQDRRVNTETKVNANPVVKNNPGTVSRNVSTPNVGKQPDVGGAVDARKRKKPPP